MADQADNLRHLIQTAAPAVRVAAPGPPMIVVAGGTAGVGATTVAVNLAAALADGGQRVLLVDTAQQRNTLTEAAGIASSKLEYTLADVVRGECSAAEAIVSGPVGMHVLAARSRASSRPAGSRRDLATRAGADFSRHEQQRLLTELQAFTGQFDCIVTDVGTGLTPWTRRLWLRAQLVLLVTTSDGQSLLDSYATIKLSVTDALGPALRVLVNQCDSDRVAADIQQRLSGACHRFLGRALGALPALPRHPTRDGGDSPCLPRVWEAPDTPFGHGVMWLGRAVNDVLSADPSLPMASAAA